MGGRDCSSDADSLRERERVTELLSGSVSMGCRTMKRLNEEADSKCLLGDLTALRNSKSVRMCALPLRTLRYLAIGRFQNRILFSLSLSLSHVSCCHLWSTAPSTAGALVRPPGAMTHVTRSIWCYDPQPSQPPSGLSADSRAEGRRRPTTRAGGEKKAGGQDGDGFRVVPGLTRNGRHRAKGSRTKETGKGGQIENSPRLVM